MSSEEVQKVEQTEEKKEEKKTSDDTEKNSTEAPKTVEEKVEAKETEKKADATEEKKEEKKEEKRPETRPRSMSKADLKKESQEKKAGKVKFLEQQSVEVSTKDPEVKGHGKPRRNPRSAEALMEFDDVHIRTLWHNFEYAVKTFGDKNALGRREEVKTAKGTSKPFKWITYKEFEERALNFASGLIKLGINPKDKLGLYSKNRLEWEIVEQAGNSQSMPTVAIYDTFGEDAISFIVNHAELSIVVTASWKETTSKLVKQLDKLPTLKYIVQMDKIETEQREQFNGKAVTFLGFNEVEELGKANPTKPTPPSPEDIAVIMYTSGTTGDPKGVIHTHRSFIATLAAVKISMGIAPNVADVYLSYLPLAHIFERLSITAMINGGASIGFYSGDVKILVEDIQELKPTLLCGVPRVFERIYQGIASQVDEAGWIKKTLFKKALDAKRKSMSQKNVLFSEAENSTPFYNKLVFEKVRNRMGGHVRMILSGAAPLNPSTHEFIKAVFGCPVLQGYGLTETAAGGTLSDTDDAEFGHVGAPLSCCEIKLVDVEEMGYKTTDNPPTGEIWIRGPNLASGYYKDEKKTKEDFDGEGWFHTGDIGRWNKNGTLSIIDRKKNIFKLSHGEYVAAEKLELSYARSRFVQQLMIYGDGFTPFLIGIVRPEDTYVKRWAEENKAPTNDLKQLYASKELRDAIMSDFELIHKEQKLNGFEKVHAVIVTDTEWTPDNELVTPTMKLRRPQLKKFYNDTITEVYLDLGVELPYADKDKIAAKKAKASSSPTSTESKDSLPSKEEAKDSPKREKKSKKEKKTEEKKPEEKKGEKTEEKKEEKKPEESEKKHKKEKKEKKTEEKKPEEKKEEEKKEEKKEEEKKPEEKKEEEGEKKQKKEKKDKKEKKKKAETTASEEKKPEEKTEEKKEEKAEEKKEEEKAEEKKEEEEKPEEKKD